MNKTDLHLGAHEGDEPSFLDQGDPPPAPKGPLDSITDGLKVFADVGLTLGKSVDSHTAWTQRLLRKLEANTPVNFAANGSGIFPVAWNLVLDLGTPDQGTYWEVESCAVGGTDVNVIAAGTAGLYVCGFVPPSGTGQTPGMTSAADYATSLPNIAFYGGRNIVVNDQEHLVLIVFGGTAGQQYVANAQATVFTTASGAGRVDITA